MKKTKKLEPDGPKCPRRLRVRGIEESMRTAKNYGRPTNLWWCALCGLLKDKDLNEKDSKK